VQLLCTSVFLSTFAFPVCRASCSAFKVPFAHLLLFQSSGHRRNFPWRNNPDLFCVVLFSFSSLLEDVLTAVMTCSHIFSAFKRDLFVFASQCDRTCVSYCSARHSAAISETCGIATGQTPGPCALSPCLDTAGNLRGLLLSHLSLGCLLAKHCLGPCDISPHLLLCCWWLAQGKTIWRFP